MIGIGVSNHKCIDYGYIDFADHVVLRSQADYEKISQRLGKENVWVAPDITCILDYPKRQYIANSNQQGTVGIFLARPICLNREKYPDMVKSLSQIVQGDFPQQKMFLWFVSNGSFL